MPVRYAVGTRLFAAVDKRLQLALEEGLTRWEEAAQARKALKMSLSRPEKREIACNQGDYMQRSAECRPSGRPTRELSPTTVRSAKRTNTAYTKKRLHTNVLAHGVGICNLFCST